MAPELGGQVPKFSKACDVDFLHRAAAPVPEAEGVGPADVTWIRSIKPGWYVAH